MDRTRTERLREDFPELYGERRTGAGDPAPVSFDCGDGWYDLLYDLSVEIAEQCAASGEPPPEVVQVKQKFGGLRFYVRRESEAIAPIIRKYEEKSFRVCEATGTDGRLRRAGGGRG